MVRHQSRVGTPSSAGELGGVQDHGIELFSLPDEPVECLKAITAFELDILETVNFGVSAGTRNGGLATVDAEDFGGAADGRGGQGEASGLDEYFLDTPAWR